MRLKKGEAMSDRTVKKVVSMRLWFKLLMLAGFGASTFLMILLTGGILKNLGRAKELGNFIPALVILVVIDLVLILLGWILPYYVLKQFPKIKYYDDGVEIGKKEKILYKDMEYFFIPHPAYQNQFLQIIYKNKNDEWNFLSGTAYPKKSFDLWQQDFLEVNYPRYMKKLENGETAEFLFKDPKKSIFAFGVKKQIAKKLEIALKLRINKESLTLENEEYKWAEYKITANFGRILIEDKAGNKILSLSNKSMLHNPNLVEALIKAIGGYDEYSKK